MALLAGGALLYGGGMPGMLWRMLKCLVTTGGFYFGSKWEVIW